MRRLTGLLAIALLVSANQLLAQTPPDPPLERGFHADSSFQIGDVDHIDLSRGSLELVIPIGQTYTVGGNLSYQLKLTYHSDIWDIAKEDLCPLDPEPCWHILAYPNTLSNAGFGWMLNLGSLIAGSVPTSAGGWKFIGPDGAEHMFSETLHEGETAYSGYGYTRDGSYLRWVVSAPYRYVETGDGTKYWFEEYDTVAHKWRLKKIEDVFNNRVEVAYATMPPPDSRVRWTITDTAGRTHTVYFNATHKHVESATLASFPGTTALYTFTYQWPQVHRSCLTNDLALSEYLNVPPVTPGTTNTIPFLTEIDLPDGSSYRMLDGTTPTYFTCCAACVQGGHTCPDPTTTGGLAAPGVIKRLWLPTGGAIAWSFQDNTYYWEEVTRCTFGVVCARPNQLIWSGVSQRTLLPASGDPLGSWTYTNTTNEAYSPSTNQPSPTTGPGQRPEERRMVVVSPDGNTTVRYFMAYPGSYSYATNPRAYGLSFTTRVRDCDRELYSTCTVPDGGPAPAWEDRYLSAQYFQGSVTFDASGNPVQTPLRSEYVAYHTDAAGTTGYRHANRHVKSTRTQLHGDTYTYTPQAPATPYPIDRYTKTVSSSFDGLGGFRQRQTDGRFGAGDVRTTFTNYNSSLGTYPPQSPPAEWWPHSSPWIINTYDYQDQTENGATARQELCFDANTGLPKRVRTFKSGTTPNQNDLLAVYTADSSGNRVREQYYGGDTQSFSLSNLCTSALPSSDIYRIDHTYQYGSRQTSRYVNQNGTPQSFYTLELDLDQSTGLPSASYQASTGTKGQGGYVAGIKTQLSYDAMGRLTWEKPDAGHGAWVHHQYLKYNTCAGPAKVETCTKSNGITTECVDTANNCSPLSDSLTRSAAHFDVLGRLVGEFTKYTGSLWNQRLTEYDAMSRTIAVSEWQQNGTSGAGIKKTQYRDFDPFGRSRLIVLPDEPNPTEQNPALLTRKIQLAYTGVSKVDRTVKIATAVGSESDATTTEEYDRQGRLWKVTESSGNNNANVTTTYAYDAGNRLTQASTTAWVPDPQPNGQTITQSRTFAYDNRGFLTSEQLPELGTSGNGTIAYSNYDARGHALRLFDGLNYLKYEFDRAERLSKVRESNSGWTDVRILRQLDYAGDNVGSDKRNGKLLTATANNVVSPTTFPVVETYTYAGVGGRVSRRQTFVDHVGTSDDRTINLDLTWTDLGQLASVTYPDDTAIADPTRTVSNTYSWGLLTAVPSFATSISYHPNLMVNQIVHANGVTDTYAKDDNDMSRPKSISTSGAATNWLSGTYGYDGAGNVKTIGASETFIYDKVSRLTSGTILAAGTSRTQTAGYDAFGNMTTTTTHYGTRAFTVNAATNHVTNWSFAYNAAGNQTAWNDGSQAYAYTFSPLNEVRTYTTLGVNRTYLYTADGERIEDWDNTANTWTISVRDLSGKVLRLYTRTSGGSWSWAKDYVYRGGLQVASIEPPVAVPVVKHFHLDHLGTIRRITGTGSPAAVLASHDLYPFGLEATSITQDTERMKFTGHERDLHSSSTQNDDLDDMHARYYNPNIARFLSTDPITDVKRALKAPQLWNKYAYVANNPLRFIDPTGKLIELTSEFKKRLENDPELKKAYEAWKKTAQGKDQWQRMATDKDTLYKFRIGTPPGSATARGQTLPSPLPSMEQGPGGQLNQPNVQLVFNPTATQTSLSQASEQTVVRNMARTFAEEASHAMDLGLGIKTYLGVIGVDEAITQGTEPRMNRFNLQLDALLPPVPGEPY